VLRKIAARLQPELLPGDSFVDFSCGQNTFAPLLIDPETGAPLKSVSFDIVSPGETHGFVRKPWGLVDAEHDLPAGELVIGINPPFGHQNKIAIDFVSHALCAKPRLLVLIFPTTNYRPDGYDLIHRDDRLCRGSVFFSPGSASSNMIDAHNVHPSFLLYKRREPLPGLRVANCRHVICERQRIQRFKTGRMHEETKARKRARELLGEEQRRAGYEDAPRAPRARR
jgi:hypothetical protein